MRRRKKKRERKPLHGAIPAFPPFVVRERLYWHYVLNTDGKSIIEKYLPFVQIQFQHKLTEAQRETLWFRVSKFVKSVERYHFKQAYQTDEEKHTERVLAFYELAKTRWDKSPGWICAVYKRSFSAIEGVLQLRRIGVGLISNSILEFTKWEVHHFVLCEYLKRHKMSFREYYLRKHRDFPSARVELTFMKRKALLEAALAECGFEKITEEYYENSNHFYDGDSESVDGYSDPSH